VKKNWHRYQGMAIRKMAQMNEASTEFLLLPVIDKETTQLLASEPELNNMLTKKDSDQITSI